MADRAPREGVPQALRRTIANGIRKKGHIRRKDSRPRGLGNNGNLCYRLSVLQALLHLPRFCNWIVQHNEPGQTWPCDPEDRNLTLPPKVEQALLGSTRSRTNRDPSQRSPEHREHTRFTGCVPCLLKTLVRQYWGDVESGPGVRFPARSTPFEPKSFGATHPAISQLHDLAVRWFCSSPEGHFDIMANVKNRNKSQDHKDAMDCAAMKRNSSNQQEANESHNLLFNGIGLYYIDLYVFCLVGRSLHTDLSSQPST